MRIDRPDEDDAPTVEPDSPVTEPDTPSVERDADCDLPGADVSDSAADRIAEHARYRALVESNVRYERASEAWTREVPALREARAELERKYPHTEQPRPAHAEDGSWHTEGLDLDSTQNSEATQKYAEIREQAQADILPAVERVAAADAGRHLVGLENWLKGEDRLKEKIATEVNAKPWLTIGQALSEVSDAVRFTLAYSAGHYAEGVLLDTERLKAEGFELIKLKKLWGGDQYKGINSQWRRPDSGVRFEVQFHTPESYEAKQLTHWAYERLRGSGVSPAERRELEAYQRQVNRLVPSPPGIADIDEVRERER